MSWEGNIDELIDKFWKGETTLEEEKVLQDHWSSSDLEDNVDSIYFEYLTDERGKSYSPQQRSGIVYMFRKNMVAIAASVAILLASVFTFNSLKEKPEVYIVDTPEEALLVTQNAFAFINSKVQKGNDAVFSNLDEFNKFNFFK